MERILRLPEVKAATGKSRSSIYQGMADGELPAFRGPWHQKHWVARQRRRILAFVAQEQEWDHTSPPGRIHEVN